MEQTTSSTLPNVVVKELAEELGRKMSDDLEKELKKKISSDNLQNSSSDILSKYIDY
ncbi:MAG: hypothetical protein LBD88_05155 [Candidatus Peribacteria bacterium]|nr:hypothetical protein [Candidatus Peribacteria bacterium]